MAKVLDYIVDCAALIIFFRQLENTRQKKYLALGLIFLIPVIPLYMTLPVRIPLILRTFLRIVSAYIFLRCIKTLPRRLSLYFSLQLTCFMMAFQSVRPFLVLTLHIQSAFAESALYDVMELAAALLLSAFIPAPKIKKIELLQGVVLVFVFVLVYYSKSMSYIALAPSDGTAADPMASQFSVYTFMILLLSLVLLMLYDRMFIAMKEASRQEMLALGATYQYNNLKDKLSAQDSVSKIYHDMKNHLLAIRSMPDQTEGRTGYIDTLIKEMDLARGGIETGNAMLNGFLHEKNLVAKQKNIQMGVCLDVTPLDGMDPVDLCSIIGNAVDNAIEAAEKVEDESERFINLRSSIFANQLVLNISNSCTDGTLVLGEGGLPETTKADPSLHGIGTRSISDAVRKYGGTLNLAKQDKNVFALTIMLPVRAKD